MSAREATGGPDSDGAFDRDLGDLTEDVVDDAGPRAVQVQPEAPSDDLDAYLGSGDSNCPVPPSADGPDPGEPPPWWTDEDEHEPPFDLGDQRGG